MTPSILETDVFKAMRTFILSIVDCEVIRTQVNKVSTPKRDFIALTPTSLIPLETNTDTWTDTTKSVKRSAQMSIQVDCYGLNSVDRAQTIAALFRDDYACQYFASSGFDMQPLYASDAQQMPITSGEDTYIERWTFECVLQINPVITVPIQTANTLTAGLISVDRTYPP